MAQAVMTSILIAPVFEPGCTTGADACRQGVEAHSPNS
jgi:hypothetical protein